MSVKCPRCGLTEPAGALDGMNRCMDWRCPIANPEARMARARVLAAQVEYLTRREAAQIERLAKQ
jgi:hypothetical protein